MKVNLLTEKFTFAALLLLAVFSFFPLNGNDTEASSKFDEGYKLYNEREFRSAAKCFSDSFLLADSPVIRANSLKAQIGAYRMCGLYYDEFQAIETLLEKYSEFADYKAMVEREFEIGDEFHRGRRDPAFWSLRWIPWLTGPDHTEEIYTKALKRSPFSAKAPAALLNLAHWYEMEGKTAKSLEALRTLLKNHPKSKECKYGLLALGNGLLEVARKGGDGDGQITEESLSCFNEYNRLHPNTPELNFAKRKIAEARDVQAQKLFDMAEYYRKSGRSEVAARYLAKLLQNFPDSRTAEKAEKILSELDKTYLPGDFPKRPADRLMPVNAYLIPSGAENELISPFDKGNHYLLPVPDLKADQVKTDGK